MYQYAWLLSGSLGDVHVTHLSSTHAIKFSFAQRCTEETERCVPQTALGPVRPRWVRPNAGPFSHPSDLSEPECSWVSIFAAFAGSSRWTASNGLNMGPRFGSFLWGSYRISFPVPLKLLDLRREQQIRLIRWVLLTWHYSSYLISGFNEGPTS